MVVKNYAFRWVNAREKSNVEAQFIIHLAAFRYCLGVLGSKNLRNKNKFFDGNFNVFRWSYCQSFKSNICDCLNSLPQL